MIMLPVFKDATLTKGEYHKVQCLAGVELISPQAHPYVHLLSRYWLGWYRNPEEGPSQPRPFML